MILENEDLDKFAEMIIKPFEHSLRVFEELKKKTDEELAYLLKITIAAETDIFSNFEALLHEVIDRLEGEGIINKKSCPLYIDYKKSCKALKEREEELKSNQTNCSKGASQ